MNTPPALPGAVAAEADGLEVQVHRAGGVGPADPSPAAAVFGLVAEDPAAGHLHVRPGAVEADAVLNVQAAAVLAGVVAAEEAVEQRQPAALQFDPAAGPAGGVAGDVHAGEDGLRVAQQQGTAAAGRYWRLRSGP